MRAGAHVDLELEPIAADETARRMDDDLVADRRAFRVEIGQHPQRTPVAAVRDRPAIAQGVDELQPGVPTHRPDAQVIADSSGASASLPDTVGVRPSSGQSMASCGSSQRTAPSQSGA